MKSNEDASALRDLSKESLKVDEQRALTVTVIKPPKRQPTPNAVGPALGLRQTTGVGLIDKVQTCQETKPRTCELCGVSAHIALSVSCAVSHNMYNNNNNSMLYM